jgi:hypothetical protein
VGRLDPEETRTVKRLIFLLFVLTLVGAVPSFAETIEGILIDNMCSAEVQKKGFDAAKAHSKECALMDDCKSTSRPRTARSSSSTPREIRWL